MGIMQSPLGRPRYPLMWADFQALCDLGGRVAGSASEAAELAFARERLGAVPGAKVRDDPVDYPGWRCRMAQLTSATTGVSFQCTPLLGTASAVGAVAEELPPGLGRGWDFGRPAQRLPRPTVMTRPCIPTVSGRIRPTDM